MKLALLLFAITALTALKQVQTCDDSVSEFIKKKDASYEAASEALKNIVAPASDFSFVPPPATLYPAVAQFLSIPETTEGKNNFTEAFDSIANGYFTACYGTNCDQESYDAYLLLQTFLELLDSRTQLGKARSIYGKLICLSEFNGASDDQGCAAEKTATGLTNCLDIDSCKCLFNIDSPDCKPDPDEVFIGQMDNKTVIKPSDCLGFVIDTTGSLNDAIEGIKKLVQKFITMGEEQEALCYVLSTFSNSGMHACTDHSH